jgi:signal transduction histidine kinase
LLGPADQEGPALKARRARALAAIAQARMGNAGLRFGASAMAALVTYAVFGAETALFWLAGLAFVVFGDYRAHAHQLKRCQAGDPPGHMPRMIAWTAFQAAYGNSLAVVLWFSPIAIGETMAALFLCGSLANAAATLRHSKALSAAALSSTILYLIGLPIADFFVHGADNMLHLVPLVGIFLLLAWGVKLWKSLLSSDAALASAESAALRERQAAAAAAAAKTDTIQRMKDELRTPIAALAGAAEHLRRAAATPAARTHIAALIEANEVLRLVLNDLSDLDRLENGQVRIQTKATDIRDLMRGVVAAFRPAAQDKGLELFLDIDADMPPLLDIDAPRVRQILFNLLANAVRFTGHGGVRVRARAEPVDAGGARLSIEVADTGAGISRSQLAVLLGRTRATRAGASGLGLAISLKLARLMGGDITAQSELSQGSRFTFTMDAPVFARRPAVSRGAA